MVAYGQRPEYGGVRPQWGDALPADRNMVQEFAGFLSSIEWDRRSGEYEGRYYDRGYMILKFLVTEAIKVEGGYSYEDEEYEIRISYDPKVTTPSASSTMGIFIESGMRAFGLTSPSDLLSGLEECQMRDVIQMTAELEHSFGPGIAKQKVWYLTHRYPAGVPEEYISHFQEINNAEMRMATPAPVQQESAQRTAAIESMEMPDYSGEDAQTIFSSVVEEIQAQNSLSVQKVRQLIARHPLTRGNVQSWRTYTARRPDEFGSPIYHMIEEGLVVINGKGRTATLSLPVFPEDM